MTSFGIKIVAILAMTFDHIGKIIGQGRLLSAFPTLSMETSSQVIHLLNWSGRIAFPLFAFLLAEGFSKTSNMLKYVLRLALFAFISEPFFYYAFTPSEPSFDGFLNYLCRFNLTNVFFTYTFSALAIYALQNVDQKFHRKNFICFIPIIAMAAFFAEFFNSDYGAAGVFLIIALYFVKKKQKKMLIIFFWAFVVYIWGQSGYGLDWSMVSSYNILEYIFAISACIFIWLYNFNRGNPIKWCFYIYYPAHLIIIKGLSYTLS